MIIMVIAEDNRYWDDGCRTVIVGNNIDEVINDAIKKNLYEHPYQIFEIESNTIVVIGEAKNV